MERPKRAADGGLIYHVLNRANARMAIFEKRADFATFQAVLEEALNLPQTAAELLALRRTVNRGVSLRPAVLV